MQIISNNINNILKSKALKLQRKVLINKNLLNSSNLFCMNNKFYTSNTSKISQQHPGFKALKKEAWYEDYMSAANDFSKNNLTSALQTYYRVLQRMQSSNQKGQAYYYKIFQKILQINFLLNRPLQTEENLYKLIKTRKQLNKNPILVYENYQDLMIHQIQHNVQKGIKLGKALLSQSQINNLPINIQKSIRMLLGNGYLLIGNNPDAKKKYGQVLEMKPTHRLKGMIMNNLAVACWWHKNPLYKGGQYAFDSNSQVIAYDEMRINRDFKQTKQLIMNSIGALENIQQLGEINGDLLQSLLNEITETMIISGSSSKQSANNKEYLFHEKISLKSIFNIIQYYIYNDPIQKSLILAWMRILIKNAARLNCPEIIDEITAKYYLLNGDMKGLKDFLVNTIRNKKNLIQLLEKDPKLNNLDKKELANYIQLLKMYSITKQAPYIPENGDKKLEQNKKIVEKLKSLNLSKINTQLETSILSKDPYFFKRQFIMTEDLSFMKIYYQKIGLEDRGN